MLAEFNELPGNSRIWIYQANRAFNPEEISLIEDRTKKFISGWQSHGKALKAAFRFFLDRFIIIAVDESYYSASGCSIDSSVELIRILEKELDISLLDRNIISYLKEGKIVQTSIKALKNEIADGNITPETVVFNNTLTSKSELENSWQTEAGKTWISRYFPEHA